VQVEIADLSEANFQHLPDWSAHGAGYDLGCKFCLYWEEPDRARWPQSLPAREATKREWFGRVAGEFGVCGKLAFAGPKAVAYAQFSPPHYLPNLAGYECGPPSSDAVFVACLFVAECRRRGIGSTLLQEVAMDLRARDLPAMETFARKRSANNPSGPLQFWLKHGFSVVREDSEFALVRRELR